MRVNGYYWVKDLGSWIIAEWIAGGEYGWTRHGDEDVYNDAHFEEIIETRITKQDK